jgi:hypothetical protein
MLDIRKNFLAIDSRNSVTSNIRISLVSSLASTGWFFFILSASKASNLDYFFSISTLIS